MALYQDASVLLDKYPWTPSCLLRIEGELLQNGFLEMEHADHTGVRCRRQRSVASEGTNPPRELAAEEGR